MIVIRPCGRSMRHDPVIASAINATCSAALAATPRVRRHPGGRTGNRRSSNSGEHLSQPLRGLDQPRRADCQRDAEESLPTGTKGAPGKRHHPCVLERPSLKRGRRHALGKRRSEEHTNSSHTVISYAVFCLKKKKKK